MYDDSMSIEERQAALAAFHADVPFLIMQTESSGVGLNLQIATTVTPAFLISTIEREAQDPSVRM